MWQKFQKDWAVYWGREKEKGFAGFISEENFFLILEIDEILERQIGQKFLTLIKEGINSEEINHLTDFEEYIGEKIKEVNLPTAFSLSAGFVRDNILYLKTINQGEVYIYRAGKLVSIIRGNLSASGFLQENDLIIFTSTHFIEVMGAAEELRRFLDKRSPNQIVEEITPILKGKNDQGVIALFVQFKKEAEDKVFKTSIIDEVIKVYRKGVFLSQKGGGRKAITFLAVVFIFLTLVWSVIFGYQRRRQTAIQKKYQLTKSVILQKLEEAEESSFFSISKSQSLIKEAKREVETLKKEVGSIKQTEELAKLIKERESQIFKKEEKRGEEFFDLAVDERQAKGDRFYLEEDLVAILDRGRGVIYILSLTKKSLERKRFDEIKKAQLLASFKQQVIFYVAEEGLYKINSEGKLKKIIEKDKDWGNIVDFWIYNGNLYLLDEGKSEIYKYLVTEEGYSAKTYYFKGVKFGLKDANSLAIDSSVYIGFSDHIFKFTAGSKDEFKTSFPDASVNITKIFTTKDLEKVYAWDKSKGAIYILGKNGTYEREINSAILKQASDFIVYQGSAYILLGGKIYKITLD